MEVVLFPLYNRKLEKQVKRAKKRFVRWMLRLKSYREKTSIHKNISKIIANLNIQCIPIFLLYLFVTNISEFKNLMYLNIYRYLQEIFINIFLRSAIKYLHKS